MVKRFSMSKRWLLKEMRCGVVSPQSFTDNSGIHYFGQAYLRKAMDLVEGKIREYKLK